MATPETSKSFLLSGCGLFTVVLLVAVSHCFLDTGIAAFFSEFLRTKRFWRSCTADIPDILLSFSIIVSGASWVISGRLRRRGILNSTTYLFQLIGWTVPLAFLLKSLLKPVFGKVNTRVWLTNQDLYGFHWLNGSEKYSGFPSGHMAIFTVLLLALWRYFPRWQNVYASLLLLLAAALIATDYHFLSDVLAGAYLGFVVDRLTCRFIGAKSEECRQAMP